MIKALERAIEKIKTLSEQRQQYAAEVLEEIAELGDDEVYDSATKSAGLCAKAWPSSTAARLPP